MSGAKQVRLDPVREAQAAAALRESIRALDPEDDALLIDTIEGETGLFEIIDALLLRIAENRAGVVGIDTVQGELGARRVRFEQRMKADRALIEQAMMIADLPKIERPAATLSLRTNAPKSVVEEEADIPAEFWKAGDPTLDKKALLAALNEGRAVPGARLENGAPSLTVRIK